MELLKLPQQALETAHNVGAFVVDRLMGGAWAALADLVYGDETHAASMDHMENVIKGTE